ncbi:MAG TPA: hypothetical protein VI728_07725 [Syntrophales bacterium]|nr:hypothetical protein [Syntrophales bacterium]
MMTNKRGNADAQSCALKVFLIEFFQNTICHTDNLRQFYLCENNTELIPAIAECPVHIFPDRLLQNLANFPQQSVSALMTGLIVEPFEVVNVHKLKKDGIILPFGSLRLHQDCAVKIAAIIEIGQPIKNGLAFQLAN